MLSAILGCIIFFAAIIWIAATFIYHTRRLRAFFHRVMGLAERPSSVDVTLNQMYGDVRVEQREGSSYRKSRNAIKGG